MQLQNFFVETTNIELENDAEPQAAAAAVVLGGCGIFAGTVDRSANLASAFLVGDCGRRFRCRGVMVCSEVLLAGPGTCSGHVASSGRFSDSGSRPAVGRTPK